MKIGVMSDLHLGHKEYGSVDREQDFYQQLTKCKDELNTHECDIVIIAGDIFDKPNPSPEAIHQYLDIIGELSADVIIAIKGNHTMLLRDNHYAVDNLVADDSGFEGYFLLEDSTWESKVFALSGGDMQFSKWKDANIVIDGITYRSNTQINEFIDIQKKIASQMHDKNVFRILVLHQSFKEFCGFLGEELSIKDIEYAPYDVIICGHIHSHLGQRINKKTYFLQPGSIERLNITEARDEEERGKGVYIIDTETETIDFCPVPCARRFFYDDIIFENKDEIDDFFIELQKTIDIQDEQPIISFDFKVEAELYQYIRDKITELSNILINNTTIHLAEEDIVSNEITETEIPNIADAIKMYGAKHFSGDELKLAIDLFQHSDSLEDMKKISDDYKEEKYSDEVEQLLKENDISDIIEYFDSLEV